MQNNRGSSSAIGFLVGAAVGSLVALLLAPKSGKDSQRWVADTVKNGVARVKGQTGDLKDHAQEWGEKGKTLGNDLSKAAEHLAS
jgi:gas vesicle protein